MVTRPGHELQEGGLVNQLINGGFRIWQRGTSFTLTSQIYTADKWFVRSENTNSVDWDVERTIDSKFGQYAVYLNDRTTDDLPILTQEIEDVHELHGHRISASAWVKTGSGNPKDQANMQIRAKDGNNSLLDKKNSNVDLTTAYRRLTNNGFTVPNGTETLEVLLRPLDETLDGEIFWDGVTLVVGDEPVDYPQVMRPIGQERSLCERYYEIVTLATAGGRKPVVPIELSQDDGSAGLGPRIRFHGRFREKKSASPTITVKDEKIITSQHGDDSSVAFGEDTNNWDYNSLAGTSAYSFAWQRNSSTSQELANLSATMEAEVT